MLGPQRQWLESTPAFSTFQTQEHAVKLLQVRVLAFASATWLRHSSSVKKFIEFCTVRELNIFYCTPYAIHLFLLNQVQDGVSYGTIVNFLDAPAFILRFYDVNNFVDDPTYDNEKICKQSL